MNYKKFLCFMLSASLLCGGALVVNAAEFVPSTENVISTTDNSTDSSSDTDTADQSETADSTDADSDSEEASESDSSTDIDKSESDEDIEIIVETEVTEEAETVENVYTDQSTYSSSEAKQICYTYLTQTAGLNSAVACGIMANISQECAYWANNVGDAWQRANGYTDITFTNAVDNGTYTRDEFIYDKNGYGLCQWGYWSAKRDLYDYAKASGTSIGNLYMQLSFLVSTLDTYGCWDSLKDIPDTYEGAYQAGWNFCENYERPGNINNYGPTRGGIAQQLWTEFTGGTGTGTTSTGGTTTGTTTTDTTEYVTGTYVVKASSLNVRTGNATDYGSMGYLSNGTEIQVTEVSNGWGKIDYEGMNGWVSLAFCKFVAADKQETTTTTTTKATTTTEKTTTTTTEAVSKTSADAAGTLYEVTASSLNIRSGAGTSYSIVGTVKKGEQVTVTGTEGSWYKISYNGITGYFSSKYCQKVTETKTTTEKTTTTTTEKVTTTTAKAESTTTTTTAAASSIGVYRVTASSLTVRKGPSTSYSSLGTLTKGTEVSVQKTVSGWAMITYNGQTGYVSMNYLQLVSSATTTTTEKATTTTTEKPTTTTTEKKTTTTTATQTIGKSSVIYRADCQLNVRSGPGTSYTVVGVLKTGEQVTVYSITGTWAEIQYNGTTAYTSTKYLTYVGEAAHECTYDSGVIVKEATCTETGLITYTCTECGSTKDNVLPIDPDNHVGDTAVKNASESTYTTKGYTGDTYCEACGAIIKKGEAIPVIVFAITKQPTSVVVAKAGYYANFTVEATGIGLTYEWYWKMPSDSSYKLSNITGNTYRYAVTAARNGRQLYCKITDANGNTRTTNVVTMTYAK